MECKKCIYFTPYNEVTDKTITETIQLLREEGLTILGWCRARKIIVKYPTTGKCPHYKPKKTQILIGVKK